LFIGGLEPRRDVDGVAISRVIKEPVAALIRKSKAALFIAERSLAMSP
jgi:hypothetical protein